MVIGRPSWSINNILHIGMHKSYIIDPRDIDSNLIDMDWNPNK